MSLRIPEEVLKRRLMNFQEKVKEKGIDAVMLRTLSSFIYFTGTKWLRPSLLIPAEGEPIAFIARGEGEGFLKRTWIRNLMAFTDGGDLMAKVSGTIRKAGYKTMGMEFGIERDAYALFYETFKRLNPGVKVVDVGPMITEMKIVKDEYELDFIRKAGAIASKAMEKTLSVIKPGMSETDIAAEAYSVLYKLGSEEPRVHVNVGPDPRVHAEPMRDSVVKRGVLATVVIGADYNRYYANMSRTIYVGEPDGLAKKALDCMEEVYELAVKLTKPGTRFINVMKELDKVYARYGLTDQRVIGYVHGVGLQVEEAPITTILPGDRSMEVKPNMALAFVHSPMMLKGLGQVKKERTFIVREDGGLEPVTMIK